MRHVQVSIINGIRDKWESEYHHWDAIKTVVLWSFAIAKLYQHITFTLGHVMNYYWSDANLTLKTPNFKDGEQLEKLVPITEIIYFKISLVQTECNVQDT